MRFVIYSSAALIVGTLSACQAPAPQIDTAMSATGADTCGAAALQSLVGGPSLSTAGLDVPSTSRHYGSEEQVATNDPTRLNFVHSGTAIESVTNPASTVIRIFCG